MPHYLVSQAVLLSQVVWRNDLVRPKGDYNMIRIPPLPCCFSTGHPHYRQHEVAVPSRSRRRIVSR